MAANPRDILLRPIITEKTSAMMQDNKYTFKVALGANKVEIRQAIEEIFKVKVEKINVINVKPKSKRVGKYSGMTNKYKKAIITLALNNKIEL